MTNQSVISFVPHQSENMQRHRKERSFHHQLSLINLDTGDEVITARFYGAGSTEYCCIWTGKATEHARGSSKAGGYGYHKASAAFEAAMNGLGFRFAEQIGGVGDSAMESALEAVALHLGIGRHMIHRAHP